MSQIGEKLESKSWNVLSDTEKERLTNLKAPITIKVGDKVNWINCYPHISGWLPLQVQRIEDNGLVQLELLNFLVPIQELARISTDKVSGTAPSISVMRSHEQATEERYCRLLCVPQVYYPQN